MTSRIAFLTSFIGFVVVACTYEPPVANSALTCGDGIEDPDEECDDGNREDEDGCDSNCTKTACGNGVTTYGEECDDGNTVNDDSCTNGCLSARCGDGITQNPEKCDDGNATEDDGCMSTCIRSGCGNGIISEGEVCDDENTKNGDSCNPTCTSTITTSVFVGTPLKPGNEDGVGFLAHMSDRPVMTIHGSTMYISGANTVRMIDIPTATVKTIAGLGDTPGYIDNPDGLVARFGDITGLATDGKTLWVSDRDYHVLRAIELASGKYGVSTVAGISADPSAVVEAMDGFGANARFNELRGLVYYQDLLYTLDSGGHVLRTFNPVTVEVKTVAGQIGQSAQLDGYGIAARFIDPRSITSDGTGNLYLTDADGWSIRSYNVFTTQVTTLAGSSAECKYVDGPGNLSRLNRPRGIATDGKSVYFTEPSGQTIRQIELKTGEVTTFSGTPAPCSASCTCAFGMPGGYKEGTGNDAQWSVPWGIVYDPTSNLLYVSDSGNAVIRRIQ